MTNKIEKLQVNVQKATEKVAKCKATIVRHEGQLAKKIAKLEKESGRTVDINNLDAYKWDENNKSYPYYWEACDVAGKLDDIKGAKKKLAEAERILAGHQEKLDKEVEKDNFINDNIPQVIKDFLEQWKEMVIEWYKRRYVAYLEYADKLEKQAKQAEIDLGIEKYRRPTREQDKQLKEMGLDYRSIQAKKAQFAGAVVLHMTTLRKEEERNAWLEAKIEEEKRAKMVDLINRVNAVVGTITDATGLEISEKGNLDGIIKGTKANAKVETIGAGGWNIQVFHYRTLVHEIK
jgi:hypothetical protein